jgi:hypothetical protein
MRDARFKALHRGGPLDLQSHRLLATWAASCAEHVLRLSCEQLPDDDRPRKAIATARAWALGKATVGEARAAALKAHAAARASAIGAARAAARAAGHAAATAHVAEHALRAAEYAIQAMQAGCGGRDDAIAAVRERAWQQKRLPARVRALVLSAGERPRSSRSQGAP